MKYDDLWDTPSGVIKHGVLENPRTEWRFVAGKITDFYGPFSSRRWSDVNVGFISHISIE